MWVADTYAYWVNGDAEALENAKMICDQLKSYGYKFNPICAVLGNIGWESGYNPWKWGGNVVLASYDLDQMRASGYPYGLLQFDPSANYILNATAQQYPEWCPNFSDLAGLPTDGAGQIRFMNEQEGYYPTTAYPLTFAEFKISNLSVEYLTDTFLYNYERGDPAPARKQNALYWEENLADYYNYGGSRKMKWIYYMKRRRY